MNESYDECNEREAEKHLEKMFGCTIPGINSPNNLTICPPDGNASKVGIVVMEVFSDFRQLRSFSQSWEGRTTSANNLVRTQLSTSDFLFSRMGTQVNSIIFFLQNYVCQAFVREMKLVMPNCI